MKCWSIGIKLLTSEGYGYGQSGAAFGPPPGEFGPWGVHVSVLPNCGGPGLAPQFGRDTRQSESRTKPPFLRRIELCYAAEVGKVLRAGEPNSVWLKQEECEFIHDPIPPPVGAAP
jgi:hypothetical protein